MDSIVKILPESVANQIAAGEVVQRPSSVVKELLENAVDAGVKNVTLNIKDSGKTLIQVIDDGKGMSREDTELCIKRHATSKIAEIDDIFHIRTMGFRGEALASIAAVSHFEIKSRRENDELATLVEQKGEEIVCRQSSGAVGTTVTVKNLFFNVPARRNFLKSNNVENRHIIESFQQVALTNPSISFSYYNNDKETYRLSKSNFKQRIIQIFGKKFDERLVPVKENTEIVTISGFVGKPEYATVKKSEQFFIVNDRFIKSPYLHHAVTMAYDELLTKDTYPQYFIRLEVDPSQIDVNIHPTKTEIKLIEERSIYAIVRTIVRQSLGKYNIAPSLDFNRESAFDDVFDKNKSIQIPKITVDPTYNPFDNPVQKTSKLEENRNFEKMSEIYQAVQIDKAKEVESDELKPSKINFDEDSSSERSKIIQLHNKFILTHIRSGFMVIDQSRAHQRVLFEELRASSAKNNSSQQLLFPISLDLDPVDMNLITELSDEIENLGFSLSVLGKQSISINGVPPGCPEEEVENLFLEMIESYKSESDQVKNKTQDNLAMALAQKMAVKTGARLNEKEMENIVDRLFACEMPYNLPNGKVIVVTIPLDELNKRFNY